MGIKKLPSYRDFWSSNVILHDLYTSKQMPLKRFSWLLGHFQVNNNSLQPEREDPYFDKLYKIRLLLQHLSERFLNIYHPGENQSIDESMIRFNGRSSLRQYMPKNRLNVDMKYGFDVMSQDLHASLKYIQEKFKISKKISVKEL